jgi:hypothetical protein
MTASARTQTWFYAPVEPVEDRDDAMVIAGSLATFRGSAMIYVDSQCPAPTRYHVRGPGDPHPDHYTATYEIVRRVQPWPEDAS